MSTVVEIEKAIQELSPTDLRELLEWMAQSNLTLEVSKNDAAVEWPDFASRQREIFGVGNSLPAGFVDVMISQERGE